MLSRRDLFRRLAGAAVAATVAPAVVKATAVKPRLWVNPACAPMLRELDGYHYASRAVAAMANKIDEDCLRIYRAGLK